MDLADPTDQQLKTLVTWMRDTAGQDTPSKFIWEQLSKDLIERALFLDAFVIPKIVPTPTPSMAKNTFDGSLLSDPIGSEDRPLERRIAQVGSLHRPKETD